MGLWRGWRGGVSDSFSRAERSVLRKRREGDSLGGGALRISDPQNGTHDSVLRGWELPIPPKLNYLSRFERVGLGGISLGLLRSGYSGF